MVGVLRVLRCVCTGLCLQTGPCLLLDVVKSVEVWCVCTGPSSERVQLPVSDRDGGVYGRCVKSVEMCLYRTLPPDRTLPLARCG